MARDSSLLLLTLFVPFTHTFILHTYTHTFIKRHSNRYPHTVLLRFTFCRAYWFCAPRFELHVCAAVLHGAHWVADRPHLFFVGLHFAAFGYLPLWLHFAHMFEHTHTHTHTTHSLHTRLPPHTHTHTHTHTRATFTHTHTHTHTHGCHTHIHYTHTHCWHLSFKYHSILHTFCSFYSFFVHLEGKFIMRRTVICALLRLHLYRLFFFFFFFFFF